MDGSATSAAVAGASYLNPLLRRALEHVPAADRENAARMTILLEAGFGDREAAAQMKMHWSEFDGLRRTVMTGIVETLRSDGYGDAEIQRYIGVPSAVVSANSTRPAATFDAFFSLWPRKQ